MSRRDALLVLLVLLLLVGGIVAVRKYSDTEEARLQRLQPHVRLAFERLRADLATTYGIQLYVVSTRRTDAEQAQKVATGVSATQDSWHLLGRAIDVNVNLDELDPVTKKTTRRPDTKGTNILGYQRLHLGAPRHGFRGIPKGSPFAPDGSKAYITTSSGKVWDVFHLEFAEGYPSVAAARTADAKKAVA